MLKSEHILELLRADPGLSVQQVADAAGIEASTASYHLRRLEARGEASAVLAGRERVWFASGCGFCPVLKRAIPAMRRAGVAPVALALSSTPATLRHVASEAGVAPGEARWALSVLASAGVTQRAESGKVSLVDGGEECVARALAQEGCPLWGECAPSRSTCPRPSPSRSGSG